MFATAAPLTVTADQTQQLKALVRAGTTPQRVARRCQAILLASQGVANHAIAQQTRLSRPTVLATRAAFTRGGVEALGHRPRRQRAGRVCTPAVEQRILDTTLTTRPPSGTHWSVRTLAKQLGVSRMMVQRVWQRHAVQPHRVEKFKLSTDPRFDEKVRDIVGLYLNPPARALVLCVDEKSQIQALDRTAPLLPLRPGFPERQTHDYRRYGTTTLFAAFNILTGKVIGTCQPRHRGKEFVRFLSRLEQEVPPDLEIHLVVDNYGTHKSAAVQRWLKPAKRRRFHFHFTPYTGRCFFIILVGLPRPCLPCQGRDPGGRGCGRRDDRVRERLSWSAGATQAGAGKGADEPERSQESNVFRALGVPDTGVQF